MGNSYRSIQDVKKLIFIQARLSSSRYPGKMLEKIGKIPLLQYVFKRCLHSKIADQVIVVTSVDKSDDMLASFCNEKSIPLYRGPLDDVLKRFVEAADYYGADIVCRVCGDSPFVDVKLIDTLFEKAVNSNLDYAIVEDSLSGFISEVISAKILKSIDQIVNSPEDREHVTSYIRRNIHDYNCEVVNGGINPHHLQHHTLTIDYPEDLTLANRIVSNGLSGFDFDSQDIIEILDRTEHEIHNS